MDYIYGKLNFEVEKVYYEGAETYTALVTTINSEDGDPTIEVDVLRTPFQLEIETMRTGETKKFDGYEPVKIFIPREEDIAFQDHLAEAYNDLLSKINAEIQRSEAEDNLIKNEDLTFSGNKTFDGSVAFNKATTFRSGSTFLDSPSVTYNDDELTEKQLTPKSYVDTELNTAKTELNTTISNLGLELTNKIDTDVQELDDRLSAAITAEEERALAAEATKVNIDCPHKLNIAAWKDTDTYVYTVVPSEAEPKLIKIGKDKNSGGQSIVQRQNDGNIVVDATPSYYYHATNKEYVDGIKTALEETIATAVENIGGDISDSNDSITQLGEELETTNQNISNLSDSVDTFKNEFSDFADNVETELDSKADLVDGVVPIFQLPSHVDDDVYFFVKEVNGSDFLQAAIEVEVGEMVYCATAKATAGVYYRKFLKNIDGTVEGIEIFNPILNKLYVNSSNNNVYAWSGSNLVEVSRKLGLGESSTTAYAGNKGKANREDIDKIISGDIVVGNASYAENSGTAESAFNLFIESEIPASEFITLHNDYWEYNHGNFDDESLDNVFSFSDKHEGPLFNDELVPDGNLYLKVKNSMVGNITYKMPTATQTRAGLISAENNNYLESLRQVIADIESSIPKVVKIPYEWVNDDLDGEVIDITEELYNSILLRPELITLKIVSGSGSNERMAHYSGYRHGINYWLISDPYSGNFYKIELSYHMEETMKYQVIIEKVIIGTQVTVDETTGTVSID